MTYRIHLIVVQLTLTFFTRQLKAKKHRKGELMHVDVFHFKYPPSTVKLFTKISH